MFDLTGSAVSGQVLLAGLGRRDLGLASAPEARFLGYTGPQIDAIAYNATWPNWSSIQPMGNVSSATSNTLTDANPNKNTPWITNLFQGDQLYVAPQNSPNTGQLYTILSNTDTQLTITTTFNPVPDSTYFYSIGTQQLSDSDFANSAFPSFWSNSAASGRQDLQTMHDSGFNTIRLYDWGPTRGWNGTAGTGHLAFLDQAQALGMKVIVPVSDYFLSDDQYAWNHQNPDASYSFSSAPQAIQTDLLNFISSITENGQIHPAVHSIAIGNELDLGISNDPGVTAKVQRALWWVVNLQAQLQQQFGSAVPLPFLTIPVSNADQNQFSASQKSWFQIFEHGANAGDAMPSGAVGPSGPESNFTANITGLGTYSWYPAWFYNSVNMFQTGSQLQNTLMQYDTGVATGTNWSQEWPGEKFPVPLLVTELGTSRLNAGSEDAQVDIVANQQAQVAVNYLKTSHNLMGITIFEFNDEPNKNDITQSAPFADALYGLNKYYNTNSANDFRNGTVLSQQHTGVTQVSFGSFPDYVYPVYQLFPVQSGGKTLLQRLKQIFTS
jgi:hypothetical protein